MASRQWLPLKSVPHLFCRHLEVLDQVLRPLADLAVHYDIVPDVQVREALQIVLRRPDGRGGVRQSLVVDRGDGPSHQDYVDGLEHATATELRGALTTDDLVLVGVVVQDLAAIVEVHLAQGSGHGFGQAVRDAVRVPDALTLHQLDALLLDGGEADAFDYDVLVCFLDRRLLRCRRLLDRFRHVHFSLDLSGHLGETQLDGPLKG